MKFVSYYMYYLYPNCLPVFAEPEALDRRLLFSSTLSVELAATGTKTKKNPALISEHVETRRNVHFDCKE